MEQLLMENQAIEKRTEESLIMAIQELAGIFDKRSSHVAQEMDITSQQWLVLLHLCQDPNIPRLETKSPKEPQDGWLASDLAQAINVSRPYMTTLISSLLDKGLIIRKDDPIDQRKKRLLLSDVGLDAVKVLQPYRQKSNARLFKGIPAEEREIMLRCAEKCLQNLSIPISWESPL